MWWIIAVNLGSEGGYGLINGMLVWKSLSETVFYSSLMCSVLVMVSIFHKLPVSKCSVSVLVYLRF